PVQRLLNPLTVGTTGFGSIGANGFVQDKKQISNQYEVGGSVGGPIIKNKANFFVSASPQFLRREGFYNLTDVTNSVIATDTVKVKRYNQQAFAKISVDPTSRIRTNWSVLWTPTVSTGRPPAYTTIPNGVNTTLASNRVNKNAGFFQPQTNYLGSIDFTINQKILLSVRAGP